jgi:palmitoyltransferase
LVGERTTLSYLRAALAFILYSLANSSYTIAVFTNPGSPIDPKFDGSRSRRRKGGVYEGLPTFEDDQEDDGAHAGQGRGTIGPGEDIVSVTAKSDGKQRYCKKCQCLKPDRAHHCSSCGKCVLKMDHHCPWLATCVGLRNYKPFLLFLVYTSLFCWVAFAISAWWVWAAITDAEQMEQSMLVVNTILLSVLAGIIGLVLSGFTGWHIYLVVTGQTTIESLEKTRYLTPLRQNMEHQFQSSGRTYLSSDGTHNPESTPEDQPLTDRIKEFHANALPGVLRPEEGDVSLNPSPSRSPTPQSSSSSPAQNSLNRSYASLEAQREHDRYAAYLDEQASASLPNAFDLGWKSNILHVFGRSPLLWPLPVCNTSGDGWKWDVSAEWVRARERVTRERDERQSHYDPNSSALSPQGPLHPPPPMQPQYRWSPGSGFVDRARPPIPSPVLSQTQYQVDGNGGGSGKGSGKSPVQMQPLDRRKKSGEMNGDEYDTSSDEDGLGVGAKGREMQRETANWNDLPEGFLDGGPARGGRSGNGGRGRKKGD